MQFSCSEIWAGSSLAVCVSVVADGWPEKGVNTPLQSLSILFCKTGSLSGLGALQPLFYEVDWTANSQPPILFQYLIIVHTWLFSRVLDFWNLVSLFAKQALYHLIYLPTLRITLRTHLIGYVESSSRIMHSIFFIAIILCVYMFVSETYLTSISLKSVCLDSNYSLPHITCAISAI